jgi:hypothetical protein
MDFFKRMTQKARIDISRGIVKLYEGSHFGDLAYMFLDRAMAGFGYLNGLHQKKSK